MLKETLCQIGLTTNEAKIYIVLVGIGSQPANIIAKKAGLKRPTVYPILEGLEKKSLISSFLKNGIRYFFVNDVKELLEYVERKKRLMDHHRDFVMDILPKMEMLKGSTLLSPFCSLSSPKFQYFEGAIGAKTVLSDVLKTKGPVFSITAIDKWISSDLRDFVENQIFIKLLDSNIPFKGLTRDTVPARCFFETCKDVCFIKDGGDLFDNIVSIYDNKVAIVSLDVASMFGVLIESEEFAKTQKSIFNLAWEGAVTYNHGT